MTGAALTPNQQRALGAAPQRERAKLRALYKAQREQANRPPPQQKQAPRAKARPAPKGKARGRGMGGLTFNGFNSAPMPLAFSVGRATRLQGLSRGEINTNTGAVAGMDYIVAIFNGTPGHYVGQAYDVNSTAGTFGHSALFTMEAAGFDNATTSSTRPDTAMCSKMSVRIRNISKAVDVAGVVRVLNVAAGINVDQGTEMQHLVNYVNDHPRTRTFGASELRSSRQFDSHPVDQSKYHAFIAPGETSAQWNTAIQDPAMSSIVMVFPVTPLNHYEVTVNAHYYARYRVTGPLANMAGHPPTAPVGILNRARDEAERLGSEGYNVASRVARYAEKPFGEALGAAAGSMIPA